MPVTPENPSSSSLEEWFTPKEAATYLGKSESWLARNRNEGATQQGLPGPSYSKLPGGGVRYRKTRLDQWKQTYPLHDWFTEDEAADHIGFSVAWLREDRRRRKRGEKCIGPPFEMLGRHPRYNPAKLDGWMISLEVEPGEAPTLEDDPLMVAH